MNKLNLKGMKFGKLLVVCEFGRTKGQSVLWKCLCDCGGKAVVTTAELKNGHVRSCGCLRSEAAMGNKSRLGKPHTDKPSTR